MRADSMDLENGRLEGLSLENYPWFYERHRLFPDIFEKGRYKKILDVAAGVGVVAKRIKDNYDCRLICNEMSTSCLESLHKNGIETVSFDLDDPSKPFPFEDNTFDAVISLATLEHMINIDEHMSEIKRILKDDGHLFISTPNYSGLQFIIPFIMNGKTFHDPFKNKLSRYEFYAHVRYFTYKTLSEYISSLGFTHELTYLPIPRESSRYRAFKKKSIILAGIFKIAIILFYSVFPPRWAFHPVLRFSKTNLENPGKKRKARKKLV